MVEDYAAAEVEAQRILSQPGLGADVRAEAMYYLGLSLLGQQRFVEARETFSGLIRLRPADAQTRDRAYLGLFNAHYLNQEYTEALGVIRDLVRVSPRSSAQSLIHLKIARTQLKLANWKEAHATLQKILTEFPDSFEAHTARQLLEEEQFFAVQVGAFLEKSRAESLLLDLSRRNQYAYIVETIDREQRKFYRVRVGKMASLNEALALERNLIREGFPAQVYP